MAQSTEKGDEPLPAWRDPVIWIPRNSSRIMNPAHFGFGRNNCQKQERAEELMLRICSAPIESQAAVAELIATENEGITPYLLYSAVRTGHVTIAKAIEKSGKVSMYSGPQNSIDMYRNGRTQDVLTASPLEKPTLLDDWLREFPQPEEASQLMFDAAVAGDETTIAALLRKGVKAHPETNKSLATLHAACHHGHLSCAKLLVDNGIDVNIRDGFGGGTPLMRAAVGARTEVVRWLLGNGADATIRVSEAEGGFNALEYGAGRDAEVARLLIGPCGFSPAALMAAASFGNKDAFDLIFEAGRFPLPSNPVDDDFWSERLTDAQREAIAGSIDRGASGDSVQILTNLLSYVPQSQFKGSTMIAASIAEGVRRAAMLNKPAIVRLLLPIVLKDRKDDQSSNTINHLFSLAAERNARDSAKFFLDEHNANVNFLDSPHNTTPLYAAVKGGHTEMARLLIRTYGADIHIGCGKFANGPTPLWLAIEQRLEDMVRLLLSHGGPVQYIDPNIQAETTRIFAAASRSYRAPVRLLANMDPDWDDEDCSDRFICLEFPDGWPGEVQMRRADAELKRQS